jgi:hypothetical protein
MPQYIFASLSGNASLTGCSIITRGWLPGDALSAGRYNPDGFHHKEQAFIDRLQKYRQTIFLILMVDFKNNCHFVSFSEDVVSKSEDVVSKSEDRGSRSEDFLAPSEDRGSQSEDFLAPSEDLGSPSEDGGSRSTEKKTARTYDSACFSIKL